MMWCSGYRMLVGDPWLQVAVVDLLAKLFEKTKLASGFVHLTVPNAYAGCCACGEAFGCVIEEFLNPPHHSSRRLGGSAFPIAD